MARSADHDAGSPTAHSAQRRPAHKRRAPGPEAAAIVLTPDGKQRLAARTARLATELIPRVAHYYLDDPDHEGWASVEYGRAVTELASLTRILQRAITTDQLPPENPGIVELGDEVAAELTRLASQDRQGDLDRQAAQTIQRHLTGDGAGGGDPRRLGSRSWSSPARGYWLSGPYNHRRQSVAGRQATSGRATVPTAGRARHLRRRRIGQELGR
jgi:hypothetical protein